LACGIFYLPHAQTAIYDSKGKVIFKTGNIPSTWSWLNAIVRFECENSAIDVIIKFFRKNIPQANHTCGFDHR
jgi:hypothetical protein